MKMIKILFILLFISNLVYAGSEDRIISVTGRSKVILEAQYSIICTEIKCINKEMDKSFKELQQNTSEIIDNLKKIGILEKEITKSFIDQGPEYTWKDKSKEHAGYYSTIYVQLKINNLNKLRLIYKELSKYDNLTILDTEYGRTDEFQIRNTQFKKALLAAKEKAKLMAECLDAKIGAVIRIKEMSSKDVFTRSPYENTLSFEKTGGTFGSVEIDATVSVDFELK